MKEEYIIRISRSKYIEKDRPSAVLRLNLAEHFVGQPIMVRYYVDETQSTIDCITAIGIKDGIGKDCYRIISLGGMDLIRGVISELPDVSALVHGEIYLYEDPETLKWYYVYLLDNERQIEEVIGGPYVFLNIEDRIVWYFNDGVLRREGDFYTRKEVDKMHEGIQALVSELEEELNNKIQSLDDRLTKIEGDLEETIPDLNQKIEDLDNKLTNRIDTLESEVNNKLDEHNEWLIEIDKEVFPVSLSFSNITGNLFLTGTTQNITFKASVTRKGENITDECTYKLNGEPVVLDNMGQYTKNNINTTTTFTLEATYTKLGLVKTASNTVNFGYNFYYGVIPATGWDHTEENIKSLSNTKLQVKQNITFITNLNQEKIAFACPKIYGKLTFIKDSNNLDYLSDYNIEELTIDGYNYFLYTKKVESTISNFYQIFTY